MLVHSTRVGTVPPPGPLGPSDPRPAVGPLGLSGFAPAVGSGPQAEGLRTWRSGAQKRLMGGPREVWRHRLRAAPACLS